MSESLLEMQGVTLSFGGLKAVSDFHLRLQPRQIVSLIGPNGAGKTTIFNLLTGIYPADHGNIQWQGKSLHGLKPAQIAALGIARTFQNIRLFRELTVLNNVRIAMHRQQQAALWEPMLSTGRFAREEEETRDAALKLLDLFGLRAVHNQKAGKLPYGAQRQLEIARALATKPQLLLLDEPAAGLNPQETMALMQTIRRLRDDFQIAILVIEHHMRLVMRISDRITVLDHGVVIADGTPAEIQNNQRVIDVYLGTAHQEVA